MSDDGLTNGERAEYAERYNEGVGRKTISAAEKAAYEAWKETTDRETLIAQCSTWSGWATDNDHVLPELAKLGGFLLEVKDQMRQDREGRQG